MEKVDLVIIGTGPAGNTAALYASRAGLSVKILERKAPGGRLVNTAEIENYPGTGFVTGVQLAMKMMEQAQQFGAEMIFSEAKKIEDKGDTKIITLGNGDELETKAILVATGTRSKPLDGVKGYEELMNKGVSHCIVCDGAFSKGKDIVVVGGGNSATEETLFANKLFNKVTILNSFPDFSVVEDVTMQKLNDLDHVQLETNANIKSINGENSVESVTFEQNGEEKTIDVNAVFVYVGNMPNTEFINESNIDILDEYGYVKVDQDMATSVKGIYGAGDVIVKHVRQISTAVSDGTVAAMSIKRYIDTLK
jgi:thioredoxin reductase (NADPH)